MHTQRMVVWALLGQWLICGLRLASAGGVVGIRGTDVSQIKDEGEGSGYGRHQLCPDTRGWRNLRFHFGGDHLAGAVGKGSGMATEALTVATACGCDDRDLVAPLMPVQAALAAGLALVDPVFQTQELDLIAARGRVLARPVRARADMPGFDNSGMDGYALCVGDAGDGAGAGKSGPLVLPVQGVSAAGSAVADLAPGTAMRIYTGAPVPQGADAVVMQERTELRGDGIAVLSLPKPGENIRRRGEDIERNDVVLEAGQVMGARAIAACAGAGVGRVDVWRKLRVALLLTGDELTPAGVPLDSGAIWDVNTPMLRAMIASERTEITAIHQVADDLATMTAALDSLAGKVDLIVTSGGVSVGDRDHVKPALYDLGAQVAVSGVAIKPGKPVTLSRLRETIVVSLPGNPVSAYVTWVVFGAPLVARLAGGGQNGPRRRFVRADAPLRHKPGRDEFRPARITGYGSDGLEVVSTGTATHSAQLAPLATADGVVVIPGERDCLEMGDLVEFLPFEA
ncbi:MAG: molybdopterin molybdotransferase [Paracoccaceae bacterium]|jgi:molybdopterin molybdotransferase